ARNNRPSDSLCTYPTPEPANEGMNMNIEETQIQAAAEPLNEKNNQPEMEMIDPSENSSTTPATNELDTLGPTSNLTTQLMKTHQPEMTTKATHSEDAKWLSSEGFTPVVNKRSNTAKKSKLTDKSRPHEAEHRPSPYSKKGRGGYPYVNRQGTPTFYSS
ncbi:21507_t:CDS:2, partial [Gigaspora rosea]